jgi:uncharacterized RDD family membrane protein YckC
MNYIIDLIVFELGMVLVVDPLVRLSFGNSLFPNYWSSFLFALFMELTYFISFEALFQKTPGKFITGTRVTMEDGSKPDLGTIVKRTLIRFVPFEAISVDLGHGSNNKGTWWHDRWTSTRVVTKASRPETQIIRNVQPVIPTPEPAIKNNGLRFLIKFGIGILGFAAMTSAGALVIVTISSIISGTQWTGNFWEDVFPFLLLISITGIGVFGVIKLVQLLRKRV